MAEVKVFVKSAFGLLPSLSADDASGDYYVKVSLIDGTNRKTLGQFITSVQSGGNDPEFEEEFIFEKISLKISKLSIRFDIMECAEDAVIDKKKDAFVGCCHIIGLQKIRNLEVQRKLHNEKRTQSVPGLFFAEYTYIRTEMLPNETSIPDFPMAVTVDGDDFGCFCGHVYCEAIDALDLDISHLVVGLNKYDDGGEKGSAGSGHNENEDRHDSMFPDSLPLVEKNIASYHTTMEIRCPSQSTNKKESFTWKSLEISNTQNPHWNEGCSFPIDLENSDKLRSIKFAVLNDDEEIGSTLVDIPLTPVTRIYMKRIFDPGFNVRGYVVIRVGFVPFGYTLHDVQTETICDEVATTDVLGLRRKYAEVCNQNIEFQKMIDDLKNQIDELEGKKKAEAQRVRQAQETKEKKKGPSTKALWHYFAMVSEPWSKGTKVSQRKLQYILETSVPSKKRTVLPLLRATTPQPYLTFKDFSLVMTEFEPNKKDWNRMVKTLTDLQNADVFKAEAEPQDEG